MTQMIINFNEEENDFIEQWKVKNKFTYKYEAVIDIVQNFKKMVIEK